MKILQLRHDVTIVPWPLYPSEPVTFPKGAGCLALGTGGIAIGSAALVAKITGNEHDAKHRWVYVDASDVEEVEYA